MIKFKTYKFDELYTIDSGISTKPEQAGKGSPFLSFGTIFNNYFIPENVNELMQTTEEEQRKYSIEKGDIFLTRTSETADELAMSCVALRNYPKATYSGFSKRLRPIVQGVTDEKFMGFYLRSPYFRKLIQNNTIMTLRASFNENIFSYLKLHLPDYSVQKKIGNLLYSLEEKIELNNKINKDLEEMAKTIYDYWFVQFDFPDENGKPYKSSGGEMVWSEELKREIPVGWEVKKLKEMATLISGYAFTSSSYVEKGNYKLYTIKNVQNGMIISDVENELEELPNKMPLECLLKEKDIIMSLTGNVGRVGLVYEDNALLNQRVLKITPKRGEYGFMYMMLRDEKFREKLENISTGTSQKNLSPINLGELNLCFPLLEIIQKFNIISNNIVDKIVISLKENQELTSLRDWLLPMLMNGQVRIK